MTSYQKSQDMGRAYVCKDLVCIHHNNRERYRNVGFKKRTKKKMMQGSLDLKVANISVTDSRKAEGHFNFLCPMIINSALKTFREIFFLFTNLYYQETLTEPKIFMFKLISLLVDIEKI